MYKVDKLYTVISHSCLFYFICCVANLENVSELLACVNLCEFKSVSAFKESLRLNLRKNRGKNGLKAFKPFKFKVDLGTT